MTPNDDSSSIRFQSFRSPPTLNGNQPFAFSGSCPPLGVARTNQRRRRDKCHSHEAGLQNKVAIIKYATPLRPVHIMSLPFTFLLWKVGRKRQRESPLIGVAVRNATTIISERPSYIMLAITCSENVCARPCAYTGALVCAT